MSVDRDIEAEFKAAVASVGKQIENKMVEACRLLEEACKLSDETGVPFYSSLSFAGSQGYVPQSCATKFPGLDPDKILDICFDWDEDNLPYAGGWRQSEFCY